MALACEGGGTPTPKTDFLHKLEWVGAEALPAAIFGPVEDLLGVFLSTVPAKLMDVDALCASNPTVPVAFSDADIATKINDFQYAWPDPRFILKLNEWIQYGAFLNFCQCAPPTTPTAPPPPGSCNVRDQTSCVSQGFAWDSASTSLECLYGCQYYVNISWLWASTAGARIFVCSFNDAGPGMPTAGCFPTASGWYEITGGTWTAVSGGICGTGYEYTPGQYGPFLDISQVDCTPVFGSSPSPWRIGVSFPGDTGVGTANSWDASATFALSCFAAPPAPGPPPDITAPPKPTEDCSAGTLCAISWASWQNTYNNLTVSNATNNDTTNIVIGAAPVATSPVVYVHGDSHTVSGSGSLGVAAPLAILVTAASLDPSTGVTETDPPTYFEIGSLTFGNVDGWGQTVYIAHIPEIIMADVQNVTQIGYDCDKSGSLTIVELVPPPPVTTP